MKKITTFLALFIFLLLSLTSKAQLVVNRYDSITVLNYNSDTLYHAWTGGFDSPQFSEIDLNLDGIMDLFVFDRSINRMTTFINHGTPNKVDYHLAPEFIQYFPQNIRDWVLLRDFNCDGKMDIFTSGAGGVVVYRNVSTTTQLLFTIETANTPSNILYSNYQPDSPTPSMVNLYISSIDIPAIEDVDGDGDLDIITFSILGSQVEYHKNLSIERYGDCDSLDFELRNKCWGYFTEGAQSNNVVLDDSCGFNINNPERLSGGNKHSGSTVMMMDVDSNGSKDLILGDVSSNNFVLLYNSDSSPNFTSSHITAVDTAFPMNTANTVPVDLYLFPAGYYLDVNNDGVKDFLASPNCFNGCENLESVWYYENQRSTNLPEFDFKTTAFLQEDMIEVGTGAFPVFFDHNADGLMDIVIGNAGYTALQTNQGLISSLWLYENIGTASNPAYQLIDSNYADVANINLNIATNEPMLRLAPTFGDIDGDGDEDMIVGGDNGKIHYFENIAGAGNTANFVLNKAEYEGIDVGLYSVPQLIDLNRDGLLDLIIGDRLGFVSYYENTGTAIIPSYSWVTSQLGDVKTRRYDEYNGNSTPFIYDDSGDYKLIAGATNGYIYYYDSIDGNLGGTFNLIDSMYLGIKQGGWSFVNVADINNDTAFDLIVGNVAGGVNFYKGDPGTVISVGEKASISDKILVYPNPTNNQITLDVGNNSLENASVEVIDLMGRTIYQSNLNASKVVINLDGQSQGIYFVKFVNQTGSEVIRVIKK